MENSSISLEKQFHVPIDKLMQAFYHDAEINRSMGMVITDIKSMHYAILVKGRRPVGHPVSNARNVHGSSSGPSWVRCLYHNADRSVHAEARAAQRMAPQNHHQLSRKSRKNVQKSSVGHATGIIVCRFNRAGQLRMSSPCRDCVVAIKNAGLSFVVFSTAEGGWEKVSVESLYQNIHDIPRTGTALGSIRNKAFGMLINPYKQRRIRIRIT